MEPGSRGYRFKNHASGTYAGYQSHENPTDGVLLTGNRNQVEWTVQQVDQGYQIHLAQNPNLVLDLASGDKSDGAKVCTILLGHHPDSKFISIDLLVVEQGRKQPKMELLPVDTLFVIQFEYIEICIICPLVYKRANA